MYSEKLEHTDEKQILIEQTYPGEEDYIAHFYEVLPAFKDKRYITCEGKPIFIIYKPDQLPNSKEFIDLWQKLAKENGLQGIHFIAHEQEIEDLQKLEFIYNRDKKYGFDSSVLESFYNQLNENTDEFKALMDTCKELAGKYIEMSDRMAPDMAFAVKNLDNGVILVNYICSNFYLQVIRIKIIYFTGCFKFYTYNFNHTLSSNFYH